MTQTTTAIHFIAALVIGLLLGSIVEYAVHRLMHMGKFLGNRLVVSQWLFPGAIPIFKPTS